MSTIYKDKIVTQTLQLTNDSDQTVKLQSGGDNILICPSKLEITDTLIVNKLFLDGEGEVDINELGEGGTVNIGKLNGGAIAINEMTNGSVSTGTKDKIIVNETGGDGTYKISVDKSKFQYNRLYKIWMSNNSGGGGEYGLFAIPNNSTRQSTAYIYSGGDDDGVDDGNKHYDAQDHFEIAIRAKKNGEWKTDSNWNTTFQDCDSIAFVRTRIPRLDWTVDDQYEGDNAVAEFYETKSWKIWDTGIDITSW